MKIPPQQQIFNAVFSESLKLGYSTFDYLPPNSQELPFVFVGEQFSQDRTTKRFLYADVQQTIHVYGDIKSRSDVLSMTNNLKVAIRKIKRTDDFVIVCKNISDQVITESTGNTPILHAIIETEFTFN